MIDIYCLRIKSVYFETSVRKIQLHKAIRYAIKQDTRYPLIGTKNDASLTRKLIKTECNLPERKKLYFSRLRRKLNCFMFPGAIN